MPSPHKPPRRAGHEQAPGQRPPSRGSRSERWDGQRQRRDRQNRDGNNSDGERYAVRGERRTIRGGRGTRRLRPVPEELPTRPMFRGRGHSLEQGFKCGHCKRFIGPLPSGGHHRNHCPFCLYSRHVDATRSGDRASTCGALMQPIGAFQRPNGEHVLVHRCLGCGFERFNRIAADDDFDLVLALPVVPPRSARRDASGDENGGENDAGSDHLLQ